MDNRTALTEPEKGAGNTAPIVLMIRKHVSFSIGL